MPGNLIGVAADGVTALGIRGNSMFSNIGTGIHLNPTQSIEVVLLNDPDNADGGPNIEQNYPILTSA